MHTVDKCQFSGENNTLNFLLVKEGSDNACIARAAMFPAGMMLILLEVSERMACVESWLPTLYRNGML